MNNVYGVAIGRTLNLCLILARYMEATGGNRLSERMIYEMEQKRKEFKDIWSCQRSVWKSYPDLTEYGLMMANLFKIGKIPW
uniref:Uncharacterized protein n=1 Tax=Salix viminalis TaxID=40686 RepID=A0A6N2KSL3_SALVM